MIGKEMLEESPLTFAEVFKILEKRKKEEELQYVQRSTYDYAQKFSRLDVEEAKELTEKLLDSPKIWEHQAVALVNLMPKAKEDVQLIFAKERTSLSEEDIEKILETIDEYRK